MKYYCREADLPRQTINAYRAESASVLGCYTVHNNIYLSTFRKVVVPAHYQVGFSCRPVYLKYNVYIIHRKVCQYLLEDKAQYPIRILRNTAVKT